MAIVVTPNEIDLINKFNELNIPITIEHLHIGDIHIRKNNNTISIIERKAKNDLEASINDGRYKEQKARLLASGIDSYNIIYLLENLTITPKNSKKVWSAITNTQYRDKCSVFNTKNIDHTCIYIESLRKSIDEFYNIEPENDLKVNINIKKKQVTPEDWFKYALSIIPRCSLTTAESILEKYPTYSSLLTHIQNNGPDCLADIKSNNKKIGIKLSNTICNILLNKC
jgi:crossover junction endonuclease MUS81